MTPYVKHRAELLRKALPADRLEELRACAIGETPQVLIFDEDSECYRVAFRKAAKRTAAEPAQPIPREKWPWPARIVARLANDGERGVGTTLTRLLAGVGGESFKGLMASVGLSCGCGARAEAMDAKYPYKPTG